MVKPSVIAPEGICSILDGQDRILATVFALRLKDMPAGNVTHMFVTVTIAKRKPTNCAAWKEKKLFDQLNLIRLIFVFEFLYVCMLL